MSLPFVTYSLGQSSLGTRSVIPVVVMQTAEAEAGPRAGKPKKQENRQSNQASQANVLRCGTALGCLLIGRSRCVWRGRVGGRGRAHVAERSAAVRAKARSRRVIETAIGTVHFSRTFAGNTEPEFHTRRGEALTNLDRRDAILCPSATESLATRRRRTS